MRKQLVNHVMSNSQHSKIFDDLIRRKILGMSGEFVQFATVQEMVSADLYHYHRVMRSRTIWEPSVATIHHDLDDPDYPLEDLIPKLATVSRVVVLSKRGQVRLKEFGIESVVIPHGYSIRSTSGNLADRAQGVVRLGVFSKRYLNDVKGDFELLEIARSMVGRPVEFVLAGPGRTRFGSELARMGFQVEAYDSLSYPSLLNLQSTVDAQVVLSVREGGPASVVESLAMGVPVLGKSVGLIPDFVSDGWNGLLLSDSIERNRFLIESFVDSAELRRELSTAAKATPGLWAWGDVVRAYSMLYSGLD